MLPDYEIKRKTTMIEKVMPYIEFILILIIIQSSIALFTGESKKRMQFVCAACSFKYARLIKQ